MNKLLEILLNVAYWLIYLLLLTIIFAITDLQNERNVGWQAFFPLTVLCLVPNLAAFYVFYFLLFDKFLARKSFFSLIIFGITACSATALLGGLISVFIFGLNQPVFADVREFFALFLLLFSVAAIHGMIALVIKGFVRWFDEIKLREELAQKNYETEIALIKSQINPHFLFNTLNNIDVLIGKDATRASLYLNELSGILRYLIYETKVEKIALEKELEYIEKYIELQKIRTLNPDYVSFEINGEAKNRSVAPMLFFPFIENAFKHTENHKNTNRIVIKILLEKDKIIFTCENSYLQSDSAKKDFGGLGNDLIKKRLKILYPEKHKLEINDSGESYMIKLTLYEN